MAVAVVITARELVVLGKSILVAVEVELVAQDMLAVTVAQLVQVAAE